LFLLRTGRRRSETLLDALGRRKAQSLLNHRIGFTRHITQKGQIYAYL
jgi:hypothetical protein